MTDHNSSPRAVAEPAIDIGDTAMSQAPARQTSTHPISSQRRAWAMA